MKLSEAMETKRPKADTENRGELEGIEIQPAENGYTVTCRFAPKGKPKANQIGPYPDPEKYVFESAKDAAKYVEETLADHEGDEDEEK